MEGQSVMDAMDTIQAKSLSIKQKKIKDVISQPVRESQLDSRRKSECYELIRQYREMFPDIAVD